MLACPRIERFFLLGLTFSVYPSLRSSLPLPMCAPLTVYMNSGDGSQQQQDGIGYLNNPFQASRKQQQQQQKFLPVRVIPNEHLVPGLMTKKWCFFHFRESSHFVRNPDFEKFSKPPIKIDVRILTETT